MNAPLCFKEHVYKATTATHGPTAPRRFGYGESGFRTKNLQA